MSNQIKQRRNSKGHFMSVDETKQVVATEYVEILTKRWKAQTYMSAKQYGNSFDRFVRNQFVTRKGDYAVVNWDMIIKTMNKITLDFHSNECNDHIK